MSGTATSPDFDLDLALEGLTMREDIHEMEYLIKCLGEQIEVTKESIDKDWQSFAEEAKLSVDTNSSSPSDISQYIQEKVQLVKHSCTSEPISLNVFLNNVVQALERNLGQEENILEELINFAADQGFVLPSSYPESDENLGHSAASLNTIISTNEETTSALWERIRKMVARGLLANMDKLSLTQDKEEADILFAKKVMLLEKMSMLYVPSDVWKKYLFLRKQQIERYLQNPANLDSFENANRSIPEENIPAEATCLVRVSHALDAILREDYNIAELGMFPEAFQTQPEEVFNVYLSGFKNELREVVKRLHTLGRRGSVKLGDSTGNTLSLKILLAFRQCVLAASSADVSATNFLHRLQFFHDETDAVSSNFGSTMSIPGSPAEPASTKEDVPPNEVVRDEPEQHEQEIWCWQDVFKPVVSKLALAIAENIQSATRTALEKEMDEYNRNHKYEEIEVADELVTSTLDYPKQVAKSCALIVAKTDELLPFLLLKPGKEFDAVRTSFVDSLSTVLLAYHSRLSRLTSDIPRTSPIRNLYLAFNSAVYIQHTLKKYEDDYGEITSSLSAMYFDLVESLNEKIISYHYATIATVILQDVQSHHWINHKEFFEGERCSFSVQMWNYYMQGLRHDLWKMCPPLKAQAIFTLVLQYSLSCLVRRYSKAIPSYKRTKLFRSDITSVLFSISSSMLFAVSTSSTDIFNPDPKRNAVIEIHNSCSALLAIMTVITCPLETLCVFSSGGAEELIKDGHGTRTSWLSWLQPELFGEHNKSLLSLTDIQAVNVYFKLMISQPQPRWGLVLQTILLRNAYLAVTIITYLESYHIHLHYEAEANSLSKKNRVQFRSSCLVVTDGQNEDQCSDIVGSLYYVILKYSNHSKPLVNFITALINRENSWQIFSSTEGLRLRDEDRVPVWLDCIYSTFKPFTRRLTDLAISELTLLEQPSSRSFRFTSMNSLPCGCLVNKQTPAGKQKDRTKLLFEAFERVIKALVSSFGLLPRLLFKVFNRIEDDLLQLKLSSEDNTSSAGLKILGSMLFRCFSSTRTTDVCRGLHCHDQFRNNCTQLAQLIYHIMAGEMEGFYENAGLPTALETLVISKKGWILDQLKKMTDFICEMNEGESYDESGQDYFSELQFGLRVEELFLDKKGEKAIKQVYNFFQAKKDWILRRIPLVSHLGSLQQTCTTVRTDPRKSTFNPLQAYNSLGEYTFDHNAIECFPFDWEQMFQSNIGMNLRSIKRLVYNRYELQNDKDVEDDKKELVAKLKAFYDRESQLV